jgi:hypothetical protein
LDAERWLRREDRHFEQTGAPYLQYAYHFSTGCWASGVYSRQFMRGGRRQAGSAYESLHPHDRVRVAASNLRFWEALQPDLRNNRGWLARLAEAYTTSDGRPLRVLRAADIVVWHHAYTGCAEDGT